MTTPQAPARRAEVAGAGFAGLTVSTALAQRGWSVRLHEQNDTVRDFGAGIVMWRNAMLALEVIGVAQSVREHGVRPDYYETFLNGASVSLEVPGYPYWNWIMSPLEGSAWFRRLSKEAVIVPGEQTRSLLRDLAGFGDGEIDELERAGTFGGAVPEASRDRT